jgi:CheY-like chemotaxis protein
MPGPDETQFPCILVADDDPHIRRLVIAALKREKCVFEEAANGREALDAMRSNPCIRLVLLDLMMPIVSGWDVLHERQQDSQLQRIPIIVISANRGPEIVDAVDKGICAFLPKPFDISALHALVQGCLAGEATV